MGDLPLVWPDSIRGINDLTLEQKCAVYRTLLPEWIYPMFGIERHSLTVRGESAVHIRCPQGSSAVEISVFDSPQSAEPALYLHMGDNFNSQLIVLMVVVNDPSSPRFGIDRDENGNTTQLGTHSRNIAEEIQAMHAGLVPGQVRRGLRVFRTTIPAFETFVQKIGHELFFIEPLFYHNAITFERYGFTYSRGFQKMKTIHQEFQSGGSLYAGLDGTTPFRQPGAEHTVSGRSWAIHDGILGSSFADIQMYKRVGVDAGVQTFPDSKW